GPVWHRDVLLRRRAPQRSVKRHFRIDAVGRARHLDRPGELTVHRIFYCHLFLVSSRAKPRDPGSFSMRSASTSLGACRAELPASQSLSRPLLYDRCAPSRPTGLRISVAHHDKRRIGRFALEPVLNARNAESASWRAMFPRRSCFPTPPPARPAPPLRGGSRSRLSASAGSIAAISCSAR